MLHSCPSCERSDSIEIVARSWVRLDQSDPDNLEVAESRLDGRTYEWVLDESTAASCTSCRWIGWADDLIVTEVAT